MRLLLVGDHVLLLQGLAVLLRERADTEIRTSTRPAEISAIIDQTRPEIVLVESSGMTPTSERMTNILQAVGDIPVIVIAPGETEQFLGALRAGARGFVGRDGTPSQLLGCIDAVHRGEWGVPRALIGDLVQAYLSGAQRPAARPTIVLTDRERDVLRLLMKGCSTQDIAALLYLSKAAVQSNIRTLRRTLGVANRTQLVNEAFRLGLTPDD